MKFKTLTELVQDTITELSQVPGSGVQQYAEDSIAYKIQKIFVSACGEAWWPHLMKWSSHTLDGSTGLVTSATKFPTTVQSFSDIRWVYSGTNSTPLPRLTDTLNPYSLGGTLARFIEPLHPDDEADTDEKFLFKVWPLTATDTLRVRARHVSTDVFDDMETVVPFDCFTLVSGAAMLYCIDDGNNPAQVSKFQAEYTDFLGKLKKELGEMPMANNPFALGGTDEWWEPPT